MLNFVNRGWWRDIAGWRPLSSRPKLLLWQAHAASPVQAWKSAHNFPSVRLLYCTPLPRHPLPAVLVTPGLPTPDSWSSEGVFSEGLQQQGAASSCPQDPVRLFPSRIPSVRHLLGNNSPLHPRNVCHSNFSAISGSDLEYGGKGALPWVYRGVG